MKISREELQEEVNDIVKRFKFFDWAKKQWVEKQQMLGQKNRQKGAKFFIDYPRKVDGKILFDGEYFLGQRHIFVVRGRNYIEKPRDGKLGRAWYTVDDEFCISVRKCKVKPNVTINGKPYYNRWKVKQDIS